MKLRFRIQDNQFFTTLFLALEAMSKECALIVREDSLKFVQSEAFGTHGEWVMAVLNVNKVFADYEFDAKRGVLGMRMDVRNLLRCMKAADAATDVYIRLSKSGEKPVLKIQAASREGYMAEHEIPVNILSRDAVDECDGEPVVGSVRRLFSMPPLRTVVPMIETMKEVCVRIHSVFLSYRALLLIVGIKSHTSSLKRWHKCEFCGD